jgi:hypothetical protein
LKEWIKIVEKNKVATLHYLEGQLSCALNSEGEKYVEPNNKNKTWYEVELVVAEIGTIPYSEALVRPCLERVDQYVKANDITVLLGFSQGGNVIDTYLHQYPDSPIQRAIILSGYELCYEKRNVVNVPLLSYYSESDAVVPIEHKPTNYKTLYEVAHNKGHALPTSKPVIRKCITFMETGEWEDTTEADKAAAEKAEKTASKAAVKAQNKLNKAATKARAKVAQDISGINETGGMCYFAIEIKQCNGDPALLQLAMDGANEPVSDDGDRKGGAAHMPLDLAAWPCPQAVAAKCIAGAVATGYC